MVKVVGFSWKGAMPHGLHTFAVSRPGNQSRSFFNLCGMIHITENLAAISENNRNIFLNRNGVLRLGQFLKVFCIAPVPINRCVVEPG